ncbi:Nuclear envelope integral membrane protein [Carabus blaptoides fortunei]
MNQLFACMLYLSCYFFNGINLSAAETFYIQSGQQVKYNPLVLPASKRDAVQIYCYEGKPKYIIHIWQSVSLQLEHKTNNFIYYDGENAEVVEAEYEARRSSWSLNLFSWKQKHFTLDPFNQSCIGIESIDAYTVNLHVIRIDYWKVLLLLCGLILFLSAPKISHNSLFYYICGVSVGICASFLVLIYFVSKIFPKRPMMYGFVIGGWTVGVYLLQLLWDNFRVIVTTYKSYVMWYVLATGVISFVICYRLGPVSNPRSKDIIKWTLQTLALFMIFHSSHFREAAMGIIVILLISYNIPKSWISKSQTYWKRKFPPKVRILTNDEYYQQGVRETSKALSELREYCSSPKCNQWKTVLTLRNAKRFASFVEGNSHLSDEEILKYDNESIHQTELTDDEDMTDDSDT